VLAVAYRLEWLICWVANFFWKNYHSWVEFKAAEANDCLFEKSDTGGSYEMFD